MSITFSTEPKSEILDFTISCWAFTDRITIPTKQEADNYVLTHNSNCAECSAYGGALIEENNQVKDVQLSNSNAMYLLGVLGMESEYCGQISAKELFDRITVANLCNNFESTPTTQVGNVIQVGRTSEYLDTKLNGLSQLAQWAKDNQALINWG